MVVGGGGGISKQGEDFLGNLNPWGGNIPRKSYPGGGEDF